MEQLTPHFAVEEFLDKQTGDRLDPPTMLLGVLEHLRGVVGAPLPIISGYRTPETNYNVGGAPNSRHLYGDAADLPTGYATTEQAEISGAVGIGSRDGWAIHVDVRPGGPARWEYT